MAEILAIIFWVIVIGKIFSKIGKGIGGEMNAWSYKQYQKEEQKIARKYANTNRYTAIVSVSEHGKEVYSKYLAEVNELRERYGMKPLK